MDEHLCSDCLGVVEPSWRHCAHCSSPLTIEPSPLKSQYEQESTDLQSFEDTEIGIDQIPIQNEDGLEELTQFGDGINFEVENKRSRLRMVGLALTPIMVIGVAFLLLSSTIIPPGTNSLLDEYRDFDGDGFKDNSDLFPHDSTEWADNDLDGIGDNDDRDDDNDGFDDIQETRYCNEDTDPLDREDYPTDTDGDGKCNSIDFDDDGDGVLDVDDVFPLDPNEWSDFDNDGIGDNADLDDDNDLVPDSVDSNDYADTGFILTFDTIRINEQMDYFDNYGEIYICFHWNYDYLQSWTPMDYIYSCTPSDGHWTLEDYTTYDISAYSVFIDLPEQHGSHSFGMSVWDADSWEDDSVDINPSSDYNFYYFEYSSQSTNQISYSADGAGDGQGWDGVLTFTVQPTDVRTHGDRQFTWEYDGLTWSYDSDLSYSTYTYFRDLDHSVDYNDISTYARFSTPSEQYVIDLATELENMAIQNGYTTDLEIAEFIYAFVGAIEYQFDIEAMGQNEYPKFPIEMLWHQSGDCEDAAALYISLVEAIGFDAMLMVGLVKQNSEEDWGGHAWAVIYIPGHSGEGWYGTGSKSNLPFYFVETTNYFDGYSAIGDNPWYDLTDYSMYDVE